MSLLEMSNKDNDISNNEICRLCMATKGGFTNMSKNIRIVNKIFECTNLEVNINDGYPQFICSVCLKKLNNAYKFKRQCHRTAKALKKLSFDKSSNSEHFNKNKLSPIDFDESHNNINLTKKVEKYDLERYDDRVSDSNLNNESCEDDYNVKVDDPESSKPNNFAHYSNKCEKTYKSIKSLENHNKSQETLNNQNSSSNPFMCNTCGKTFTQAANLTVHLRSHTGERPFQCDVCHKSFTQVGNLYIHKKIHNDVRQYVCKQCPMAFKLTQHLKEHMKTHSTIKQHQCITCGKGFHKSNHLLTHMRIHTGEKPFSCEHCGKFFNDSSNLATHIRTHTGEKPFICKHCNKSFGQKISLIRHQQQHSDNKHKGKNECKSITVKTD